MCVSLCVCVVLWLLPTLLLVDSTEGAGGLKVSHLIHFACGSALILPSSVNSSTSRELGAKEHW